jgi:hypothetical protein
LPTGEGLAMQEAFARAVEGAVERQRLRLAVLEEAGPPVAPPRNALQRAADAVESREIRRQRYRGGKLAALLTGRGAARPTVTPRQFEAGQRWRADFEGASGLRAADPDRGGGGSGGAGLAVGLAGHAGATFARGWARLGGPVARVVFLVAVADRDPAEIARAREGREGRPVRTDAVTHMLRCGLDELADFYRLPEDP